MFKNNVLPVVLGSLLLSLAISGCSTCQPKIVERAVPVKVIQTVYKPIPDACLQMCPVALPPFKVGETGMSLRDKYQAEHVRGQCLEQRLQCITTLPTKVAP